MPYYNPVPHPDDWFYDTKIKWYEEESKEHESENVKIKKMERTKYQSLSERDRRLFLCELGHACSSNDKYFELCSEIINKAKEEGLFENVKIILKTDDTNTEK
jgi:hypothetical protein